MSGRVGVDIEGLPAGHPGPGGVHLIELDTAVLEFCAAGRYLAVCGQELAGGDLPDWECSQDCPCDVTTLDCRECARIAAERAGLMEEHFAAAGNDAGEAGVRAGG